VRARVVWEGCTCVDGMVEVWLSMVAGRNVRDMCMPFGMCGGCSFGAGSGVFLLQMWLCLCRPCFE
jgi:hypothetical protein